MSMSKKFAPVLVKYVMIDGKLLWYLKNTHKKVVSVFDYKT